MRTLTSTLIAAQQAASRVPCLQVIARNKLAGVVNLQWTRLYTGSEADSPHAATMPGDGSLIRIRSTPASDNRKLYRQRVTSPGSGSDFSQWTYLSLYSIAAVAACSLGAEVSLFWAKSTGEITRSKSTDYGVTWSAESLGTAPAGSVAQMAAAYKTNGDLALFFTDASTLYLLKRVSGSWQTRVAWDKTTGTLSGVAAVYDGDWKLLVSGKDADGNYKIWSLIYGDGSEVTAGTWSDLKVIATAPSDGNYEYSQLFLDQPDQYRAFFSEKFTGTEAYNRPFRMHTLPGTVYLDNRWKEPVPFETEGAYGLALVHDTSYAWLTCPFGVWRAPLAEETLDLSPDILSLKQDLSPDNGQIAVELQNSTGKFASLPSPLHNGCQIDLSPGYATAAGKEYSSGQHYIMQASEFIRSGGKSSLIIYASDGWQALRNWTARYQLRWNQPDQYGDPTEEASVKEVLTQVLARAGIVLDVVSESSVVTGFYPDFTVHAGDDGLATVRKLLSLIPDLIFLEGNKAYLVNPLATDTSSYSYGTTHPILEGRYLTGAWEINRVHAEGLDSAGTVIVGESFNWEEINRCGDILSVTEDQNLYTVDKALERGEAQLRKAEMEASGNYIKVPVNCGQQLYDVIAITDSLVGLSAAKKRVMGISLNYQPRQGEYEQKIRVGEV